MFGWEVRQASDCKMLPMLKSRGLQSGLWGGQKSAGPVGREKLPKPLLRDHGLVGWGGVPLSDIGLVGVVLIEPGLHNPLEDIEVDLLADIEALGEEVRGHLLPVAPEDSEHHHTLRVLGTGHRLHLGH